MKNVLFILPFLFLLSACEDEDSPPAAPLTAAEAARIATEVRLVVGGQQLLEQGYEETQVEARQEGELRGKSLGDPQGDPAAACPATEFVSTDGTFFPAVLSLDYSDCPAGGKQPLGGRIVATFDGLLLRPGTQIAIDFDDFSAGPYAVTGIYTERNDSLDAQGRQQFAKSISGAEFSRNDTLWFTYTQEATVYQVEGQQTDFLSNGLPGIFDDRYEEVLTGSGNLADGSAFTVTTDIPITTAFGCDYYTSGVLLYDFARYGVPIRLDFGTGDCDNRATMTVGDFSFPVEL